MLNFIWKLLLYLAFHTAQEEWSQNRLELLYHRDVDRLVVGDTLVEGVAEPLFKVLLAAENLRHQEVHQTPKFHHIVLKGGACQK